MISFTVPPLSSAGPLLPSFIPLSSFLLFLFLPTIQSYHPHIPRRGSSPGVMLRGQYLIKKQSKVGAPRAMRLALFYKAFAGISLVIACHSLPPRLESRPRMEREREREDCISDSSEVFIGLMKSRTILFPDYRLLYGAARSRLHVIFREKCFVNASTASRSLLAW